MRIIHIHLPERTIKDQSLADRIEDLKCQQAKIRGRYMRDAGLPRPPWPPEDLGASFQAIGWEERDTEIFREEIMAAASGRVVDPDADTEIIIRQAVAS